MHCQDHGVIGRVTARLLVALLLTSCAHVPAARTARSGNAVDGMEATRRWLDALYPQAGPIEARIWWITEAQRRELARLEVPEAALPVEWVYRDVNDSHRTDSLVLATSIVVIYDFVPMILRSSERPKLRRAVEKLNESRDEARSALFPFERGRLDVHDLMAPLFDDPLGLLARLRGELRRRTPDADELGVALYFSAASEADVIGDRGKIDPGFIPKPTIAIAADVPLPLAPLYALSAGVDPEDVRRAALALFETMGAKQHDRRVLVEQAEP